MTVTILEMLREQLQPTDPVWEKHYRDVLRVMGIHPDTPARDVELALSFLRKPEDNPLYGRMDW